jgi:hypothetical protein
VSALFQQKSLCKAVEKRLVIEKAGAAPDDGPSTTGGCRSDLDLPAR